MEYIKKPKDLYNIAGDYKPYYFTALTGSAHIYPIDEQYVDWSYELDFVFERIKGNQISRCAIVGWDSIPAGIETLFSQNNIEVLGHAQIHSLEKGGMELHDLVNLRQGDAIFIFGTSKFSSILRAIEKLIPANVYVIPASREAIVPSPIQFASHYEWGWRSLILNYLKVSGLKGHFSEFGTFYGSAFFRSYFELHHWLDGKFYAFDSFEGLSEPDAREQSFSNGDFTVGAYGYNQQSFELVGEILDIPKERVKVHKGFYDKSLTESAKLKLELKEKSISVCRIDCDLLEPTLDVLEFVEPLLEDGALLYFDDWRLCRASPHIGERGAVKQWLRDNPNIDLEPFASEHWQHQWFIFNRLK
ncbi:hypothetical protein C2869_15705 [Saccharobesus litoralis]|uniref:Uncharacterized protein n=1 Tax=Saccharobesus litoralis TaxID=2172099 RepID=A0A2S0VUK2_9ALTE|nr:TylF/MycF/NovP-related O-methyltransferase [Saccharobesus litoralis]AWB67780.1 hypothetical protein C2869_15705 [Saccharobesus litoralis]